jgi:hypothetical protein
LNGGDPHVLWKLTQKDSLWTSSSSTSEHKATIAFNLLRTISFLFARVARLLGSRTLDSVLQEEHLQLPGWQVQLVQVQEALEQAILRDVCVDGKGWCVLVGGVDVGWFAGSSVWTKESGSYTAAYACWISAPVFTGGQLQLLVSAKGDCLHGKVHVEARSLYLCIHTQALAWPTARV